MIWVEVVVVTVFQKEQLVVLAQSE